MNLSHQDLVENLAAAGWLKTPNIIKAFQQIKREDFLPEDSKDLSYVDGAFPIGYGQTISQPAVVAFMLEQLEPKEKEKILDIGAGSGWTTTLLASIVGQEGRIVAIEIVPELAEFGKRNVAKYNFIKKEIVEYLCQDGTNGYPPVAPFDRILVSASLQDKKLPISWKNQLKGGGNIVVPIGQSIWVFTKKNETDWEEKEFPGFVFVPFVK